MVLGRHGFTDGVKTGAGLQHRGCMQHRGCVQHRGRAALQGRESRSESVTAFSPCGNDLPSRRVFPQALQSCRNARKESKVLALRPPMGGTIYVLLFFTVAVISPRANLAEISSPALTLAASFKSFPEASKTSA